jgi:hypothetical protein
MKSFGLFASGANNSGDGSKQKSSELVAQSRNKRKRDGKLDCFILCITYSNECLDFKTGESICSSSEKNSTERQEKKSSNKHVKSTVDVPPLTTLGTISI